MQYYEYLKPQSEKEPQSPQSPWLSDGENKKLNECYGATQLVSIRVETLFQMADLEPGPLISVLFPVQCTLLRGPSGVQTRIRTLLRPIDSCSSWFLGE
jgi:hypothetical protein